MLRILLSWHKLFFRVGTHLLQYYKGCINHTFFWSRSLYICFYLFIWIITKYSSNRWPSFIGGKSSSPVFLSLHFFNGRTMLSFRSASKSSEHFHTAAIFNAYQPILSFDASPICLFGILFPCSVTSTTAEISLFVSWIASGETVAKKVLHRDQVAFKSNRPS